MEANGDNDIDPEHRPEVLRHEKVMKVIVFIANDLFYDPARYSPREMHAVEQLVNRIEKSIHETFDSSLYELFIYSTLLYFTSEGIGILLSRLDADGRVLCQYNGVPDDWRNAINLKSYRNRVGYHNLQNVDKFTVYTVKIGDRFYSLHILLRHVSREVEIYLWPYSDDRFVMRHETDPWLRLKTVIARQFVVRGKWLHFGLYLRYNLKKIFSPKIRMAQGLPVRSAPLMFDSQNEGSLCTTPDSQERNDANAPGSDNMSS